MKALRIIPKLFLTFSTASSNLSVKTTLLRTRLLSGYAIGNPAGYNWGQNLNESPHYEMSLTEEDIREVEAIERILDDYVSSLRSFEYRAKRMNLSKKIEKLRGDRLALLKFRFRVALGALHSRYPNLWIDFKGLSFVADAEEKHHKQLRRWLNYMVKKGYFEAAKLHYSFCKSKKKPCVLDKPGLKVTGIGLLAASMGGSDKPALIVRWAKPKSRLYRTVYRMKSVFSGENLGFEAPTLALTLPFLYQKLPLPQLLSAADGAKSFDKAALLLLKSGRFERFRKELAASMLNIIRAKQQQSLELYEFEPEEFLQVCRQLEELLVRCGVKKLNRFKLQGSKLEERGEEHMKSFKENFATDIQSLDPESFATVWAPTQLKMFFDRLKPDLIEWKKKFYVSCPMCGYEVSLQSREEAEKLLQEFKCELCGFETPRGLKFYRCVKCGAYIPYRDDMDEMLCLSCG
jgi:predicted RNA-binding Zn-ribbon protein involved in translation (DUF1610 family)